MEDPFSLPYCDCSTAVDLRSGKQYGTYRPIGQTMAPPFVFVSACVHDVSYDVLFRFSHSHNSIWTLFKICARRKILFCFAQSDSIVNSKKAAFIVIIWRTLILFA